MPTRRLGPENLDDPIAQHMRRDFTTLRAEQTVGQALDELRGRLTEERIVYFYVADSAGRLAGVVPTRRLLTAQPTAPIGQIMLTRVISIPVSATVLIACEFFIMHRFLAFPVTDPDGRMVGVVDVSLFTDEVLGLAEKRGLEDVFQLIGVHVAEARPPSPWRGFRMRFPWLMANILGGLGCALLAARFERLLDQAVVLAMFVPVVLALAESVSIQSVSITLQTLHRGRVSWRRFARSFAREFSTAALLGLACATVIGLTAWTWRGQWPVAAAIAATIWLSMITACLLGLALPSAVRAVRGDPKIAAGPIVLATADIATLLFYFTLAGWLLR